MKDRILYIGDKKEFRREQFAEWYPTEKRGGRSSLQCRYTVDVYDLGDAPSLLSRLGDDSPYLFVFLDLPGERFLRAEMPERARRILEELIVSSRFPTLTVWEDLPKCIREYLEELGFEK